MERNTKQLSFRIAAPTVADLDRSARLRGVSRNALADRYLAEGVRRDEFPEISFRDGTLGRRATLIGTRLDVWQILETVRDHDNSIDDAAGYLDLPADRVRAAVRYAAAYPDEVRDIAEREADAAARAEEIWQAERNLLDA